MGSKSNNNTGTDFAGFAKKLGLDEKAGNKLLAEGVKLLKKQIKKKSQQQGDQDREPSSPSSSNKNGSSNKSKSKMDILKQLVSMLNNLNQDKKSSSSSERD